MLTNDVSLVPLLDLRRLCCLEAGAEAGDFQPEARDFGEEAGEVVAVLLRCFGVFARGAWSRSSP